MANSFKVKTHAAMSASANTFETLYTCPGTESNTKAVVLGLVLCNVHTSQITVDVQLVSNTSDTETNQTVKLLNAVPIPAGSSLEVLSGNKVVMQGTDIMKISCSVAAKVDVALSIMEIT